MMAEVARWAQVGKRAEQVVDKRVEKAVEVEEWEIVRLVGRAEGSGELGATEGIITEINKATRIIASVTR